MLMPAANRNLLVGILALQLAFIDRQQLIASVMTWLKEKSKPLGLILVEQGALDATRRELLEPLVDEYVRQHDGDLGRCLAAPPISSSVRQALSAVADPDVQTTLTYLGPESGSAPPAVGTPTSSGGRFRILRPHAHGGLGEVYVARDEELGREVALKEILPRHATNTDLRSRFVLEAEIAGNLEHPGIVPVYGLGTDTDGRPFYAMRFIQGDSLREAIATYHHDAPMLDPAGQWLRLRKLLGRFIDVCEAIAYAHSRGVLHRDLKPDNVMLGRYGETLIVDWGLAKPLGHGAEEITSPGVEREATLVPPSGGSHEPTVAGQVLGTPAYMSPEQARGELDRLGPGTDTYSLGATLYCLLTGGAPVTGATVQEVLEKVVRGEVPPPRSLRPEVPRPLEAVCLKALALRPEDRYPSVRALAEEVEHWLADEPVSAYREGLAQRAGRWMRHHRAATQAAAAALAVIAVVATVAALLINAARQTATRALGAERDARLAEAAARGLAESRLRVASRAIDDMYTRVAERWISQQPHLEALHREFLEKARDLYLELAKDAGGDLDTRVRTGIATLRLGDIQAKLGQSQHAEQAYQQARGIFEGLSAAHPTEPRYRSELARVWLNLGNLLERGGRYKESEPALSRSVDLVRALRREGVDTADARHCLAEALDDLGRLLKRTRRPRDAERSHREAIALAEELIRASPGEPKYRFQLAGTLHNLGLLEYQDGRVEESIGAIKKALVLYDRLIAEDPSVPVYRRDVASSASALGVLLAEDGRFREAEASYRKALALLEKLVTDFPRIPNYRLTALNVRGNLANVLKLMHRLTEAEEMTRSAIPRAESLVADFPGVPEYRVALARAQNSHGSLLVLIDQPRGSEEIYRRAIAGMESLVADDPAVPSHRQLLAVYLHNLAEMLQNAGRYKESEEGYSQALTHLERVIHQDPQGLGKSYYTQAILGDSLGRLGKMALGRREPVEARRLLKRALGHVGTTLRINPVNPMIRHWRLEFTADLARTWLAQGKHHEAAEIARELVGLDPQRPENHAESGRILARCAEAVMSEPGWPPSPSERAGRARRYADESFAALRRAVELGYANYARWGHDPDVAAVLARPDLREWYQGLIDRAFPSDPFDR
jgi:serine/threonine-protein kinase